jgi:hypothetical protein
MRAPTVAEGGLLHPPADLVDDRVGQSDGVEVVDDHGGMPKRCGKGAGVAAPGIEGDRGDLRQPAGRTGAQPGVHGPAGAVGHYAQQPAAVKVDQAGDIPGRRGRGGPKEAGLVQAQRGHAMQASRVVDQPPAMLAHGSHHRRPAHPQVAGDRRHRVGVLADSSAGLGAGPLGQHRPRTDHLGVLGPGPHPTGRLRTAPDALASGQHDRAATDWQVADPNRPPCVGLGLHAARRAADPGRGRLDPQLPLATSQLRVELHCRQQRTAPRFMTKSP